MMTKEQQDQQDAALLKALKSLSDERRLGILKHFCRACGIFLEWGPDWAYLNYCPSCSPDPQE